MYIGKLKIEGRPMFSKAEEFDFGKKGLTVVHGLNLNAGSGTSAPNAAGKSMLFSNLQDLLYQDVLVGSRRDRVTAGLASLEIGKSKKDCYVLTSKKMGKDKTHSLDLSKDGVSLEFHGKSLIDDWVKKIVPPTIEAYSTLCHIDDRTPHPLVRGESAARKAFFSKFFELDSTDSLRKLCQLNLSEIRSESVLLKDRKDRLQEILDNRLDSKDLNNRIKILESNKSEIQSKVDYYAETQSIREFLLEHPDIKSVPDLKALKSRIKYLENYLEAASEHTEYLVDLKNYKLSVEERKTYLAKHDIDSSISEIKENLDSQIRLKDKIDEDKRELDNLRSKLETLKKTKPTKPDFTCDECGASLVGNLKAEHEARYRTRLLKWENEFKKVKELGVALKNKEYKKLSIEALKRDYEILRDAPKILPKPDRMEFDTSMDLSEVKEELKYKKVTYEKFEWALTPLFHRAKLADPSIVDLPNPTTRYLKITEAIATLRSSLELATAQDKELLKLTELIDSAEARLKEAQVYEILEKAYGPTGFRRMLINTICSNLEQVINRYSKGLFPEDYRFELTLEKQFDIIVNRTHGPDSSPSDVRKLSGAESSMFSLLLWIGLMSFVPRAKRPNFLILDELDSRMGPDSQDRFLAFIPKLLQVVNHVIVITPKSETRYEDYVPKVSYITVVKKGLNSSIHEGSVQTVSKFIRNKK